MSEFRITRRADALIPGPPFTANELRVLTACLLHVAGYKQMNAEFVAALQAKLVKMLDALDPPSDPHFAEVRDGVIVGQWQPIREGGEA